MRSSRLMTTGKRWTAGPEEEKRRQETGWQKEELEKLSSELEELIEENKKVREAKGLPVRLPPLEVHSQQSELEQVSGQAEMYDDNMEKPAEIPGPELREEEQKNNA
jgi:hypothetical protein